jgi:2-phospho-L-lactate guanylyltransferase
MQATVHRFDPRTHAGVVVTDDGVLVPFSAETFDASPLRLLRPGQRLTVTVSGSGAQQQVSAIALGTVGQPPGRPSRP